MITCHYSHSSKLRCAKALLRNLGMISPTRTLKKHMLKKQCILVKNYCILKWDFQASHANVFLESIPSENVPLITTEKSNWPSSVCRKVCLDQGDVLISELVVQVNKKIKRNKILTFQFFIFLNETTG